MKNRHLRLVVSNEEKCMKKDFLLGLILTLKNYFSGLFISKNEKIYVIKDVLIKIYRDYELSTGNIDIPYFVRAENKISAIIKEKKINYYYRKLKNFPSTKF
jgi:hypothetical protein